MGDTVIVETPVDEVVSIVTAGPQGPSGSEAATLTTTGDLLYRDALANDRLPIGSEGQVLKVASGLPAWGNESGAVTSVNGETGTVVLDAADVGAATAAQGALADSAVQPGDLATVATSGDYDDLTNKPSTFAPSTHASTHATGGSDAIAPSDIGLGTTDDVAFNSVTAGENSFDGEGLKFDGELRFSPEEGNFYYGGSIVFGASAGAATFNVPIDLGGINAATNAATTRTNLGLGNSATLDTGTTTGTVAAGDHTHELNALDATGATDGHVLTADGAGGAAFEAIPAVALNDLSNVSAAAPSDNDVLVYDNATSTWVAEAPSGGGGEVRSDFVSPYTYTGLADAGTSESTASWTIRRSEFDAGGGYVATLTASNVEWDDRLTASYS